MTQYNQSRKKGGRSGGASSKKGRRSSGGKKDYGERKSELQRPDRNYIAGKHAFNSALAAGRKIYTLWISPKLNNAVAEEYMQKAREAKIAWHKLAPDELSLLSPEPNHQGLVAEVEPYAFADWDAFWKKLDASGETPFLIVLDQIQDPHNLGAILRTAEAAGVHGVIVPKHGSVGLTEGTVRASAGAVEEVPVLQVTNLARTLKALQKERNIWTYGLTLSASQSVYQTNLTGPLALVIGNEHKGLRPNVANHCDEEVFIPMLSDRSLNASVATGVVVYEAYRQRLAAR